MGDSDGRTITVHLDSFANDSPGTRTLQMRKLFPVRAVNYPLTLLLMRHVFFDEDHTGWVIVEVAITGEVMAYRMSDEAQRSGVSYYRWFPGSVLTAHIQSKWDQDNGW